jgi:tRNA(His) guanylyltransferase
MSDDFGNRMKEYEFSETKRKFMPLLPVIVRIDGKNFSKFTKTMKKPFDLRMIKAMQETTKQLVKETNAKISYTQSDEITLIFKQKEYNSEIFFNGKIQKMVSVIASLTTGYFIQAYKDNFNEYPNKMPAFDTRAFQVPNEMEAVNQLLWRTQDACKNAVSCSARTFYSHKELQNKNSQEMQEMMFEKGQNFNDYPKEFKQGSFFQRKKIFKLNERTNELIERSIVDQIDMPVFSKVTNKIGVVFENENPQI